MRMDSWGPLRVYGGSPESSVEDVEALIEGLEVFVKELWSEGSGLGLLKPGNRYEVSDAATAALLLHLSQEAYLVRDNSPIVYRGQVDLPGWTIQASIDRTNKPGNEVEHMRGLYGAALFNYMLRNIDWQVGEWMSKGWRLDEYPSMAMGRHHGMSSPLIDFTVDPSAAVMFAHQQAISYNAETACVFGFAIDDLGDDVILSLAPPPFLRSARQHGIYHHSVLDSDGHPREPQIDKAVTICFPASSPPIHGGGLLRDGEVIDLLHADPLLAAFETHVRKYMAVMPVAAIHDEQLEDKSSVPESLRQMGQFSLMMLGDEILEKEGERFRYRPTNDVMNEWFTLTTDILHAVIGIIYRDGKIEFRPDLIDRLVRHNHVVMQVYLNYFMRIYKNTPLESLLPIMRVINKKLLEVSNDQVGIYSPDLL